MNKKKAILIIVTIIVVLGGCYWMKENIYINPMEKMQKQALAHVEKKYNEEFVIIGVESREILQSISNSEDTIWIYPKGGDKENDAFQVVCTHNSDGSDTFKDDYFGILLKDEYEKELREIGDKYFSDFEASVFFDGQYFPEEFKSRCSIKEAIDDGADLFPTVRILTTTSLNDKSNFYKLSDSFVNDMASKGLAANVNVFCMDDDMMKRKFVGDFQYRRSAIIDKNFNVDIEEE